MNQTCQPIRVLLVEDNPTDALQVQEALEQACAGTFVVTHVARLGEGLARLAKQAMDVVLVDLNLPDAAGLQAVNQVRAKAAHTPVMVLTGLSDEELALEAMQHGAQDYLVKSQLQPIWLARAIRYAIERQRLLKTIEENVTERQREQERELRCVEHLSRPPATEIAACYYGARPLRESQPEVFTQAVRHYMELLDQALERRIYKGESALSEGLRAMSNELGLLRAGPRDVVEIHTAALKSKAQSAPAPKAKACLEEGRLIVLELMGYLAGYYRDYYPVANGKDHHR